MAGLRDRHRCRNRRARDGGARARVPEVRPQAGSCATPLGVSVHSHRKNPELPRDFGCFELGTESDSAHPERGWSLARVEPAAFSGSRPRRLSQVIRYGCASLFGLTALALVFEPAAGVSSVTRIAHSTVERLQPSAAEPTSTSVAVQLTGGTSDDAMALSDRPDRAAARERRAAKREARRAAQQARREEKKARREQARARRKDASDARRAAALARRETKRSKQQDAADREPAGSRREAAQAKREERKARKREAAAARREASDSRRAAAQAKREERKARKRAASAARREAHDSRHAAALARREERKARKQEAYEARREAASARREEQRQRREDAAQARRDAALARRGGGSAGSATLRINSLPWAQVYIDDRMVGCTPQLDLRVTPGAHHVRLVNQGFAMQKSFEVHLKAGERVSRVELLDE